MATDLRSPRPCHAETAEMLVGLLGDAFLQAQNVTCKIKRAANEDALRGAVERCDASYCSRDVRGRLSLEAQLFRADLQILGRVGALVGPRSGHSHDLPCEPTEM